MSLIGYVTLEEANEYVRTHYVSCDSLLISWIDMHEQDQEVLLRRAFQLIETIPFVSRKFSSKQKTAFPRWPVPDVPDAVKWAQIEQALSSSDRSQDEDLRFYDKLRVNGVQSYSIGNLSENLGPNSDYTNNWGLRSTAAIQLLKPYIGGGYQM